MADGNVVFRIYRDGNLVFESDNVQSFRIGLTTDANAIPIPGQDAMVMGLGGLTKRISVRCIAKEYPGENILSSDIMVRYRIEIDFGTFQKSWDAVMVNYTIDISASNPGAYNIGFEFLVGEVL